MKHLSKGDTCRVRLHTGEVVEAVYDEFACNTNHFVLVNGVLHYTKSSPVNCYGHSMPECRFVGPPCVHLPVGVSV